MTRANFIRKGYSTSNSFPVQKRRDQRTSQRQTASIVGVIVSIVVFYLLISHYRRPNMATTSGGDSGPVEPHPSKSQLVLTINQTESGQASVRVTLTNTHPKTTISVLNWDTPFDPSAVALGVFKVVDKSTNEEVPPLGLKINRLLPPPEEDYLLLKPQHAITKDIVLDAPGFTLENGKSYDVQARGKWKAVWHADSANVGVENLRRIGGPTGPLNWEFESDVCQVKV